MKSPYIRGCLILLLAVAAALLLQDHHRTESAKEEESAVERRTAERIPPSSSNATGAIPPARNAPDPVRVVAVAPLVTKAIDEFRDWAALYRNASQDGRAELLAEGIVKARARRTEMAKLIVDDPRTALENAVPIVERQQLPPEIVELLEERISARGFYGVLGVVGAPVGEPSVRRELRLARGAHYNAFVYGERLTQTTTENAVVHGVAVGKNVALHPRRVRPLEAGEIPDATKGIFETCPVSKKSTTVARENGALPPVTEETPAVEIAGEVHYLCDGGHIRAIEEEIVAGEGVSGGPVKPTSSITSTQSTGVRTLLYMRVAFPETNRDPQTETAAYEMMRQVNDYFLENSYGNVYLLTTVTPLLVLPRSEAWYNGGGGDEYDVRTDAQALARQLGYDTSQYDLDIVAYNGGPGSFGGLGYVGGKGTWLKSISVGVACHELGHNFGLWHANFWDTGGTSTIGDGSNAEYGNSFDTMGNAGAGDLQFNAYHKSKLNWLDRQHFVHNITSSGTYRVVQFDQGKLDPGHRYAVRIRKDSDRDYWAEFRQKSLSNNRWTRDGVLLNWSSWAESNGGAQLLDSTPGSPDGKTDSALVIGRTFSDHSSGVHITPIGKAGSSPEAIDLMVNLGFFSGNQTPLATIAASAGTAAVNVPVNFTATAADPDGDPLSYAWDFGDRTFGTSNAATASKAWATAGDYVVRCVVSDMKGATASDSLLVRVGAPATFRVSGQVRRGGQPLPNVHVHNGQTGSSYRGAYSDTDGSYTIAGIAGGSITLAAALDGYSFAPSGFVNPLNVSANFSTANFNATELTQLTLSVIDPDCSEGAANPGRFRLSRTGSTSSSLTVAFFTPSGTASRTSDYTLSPSLVAGDPYQTLVIPAGQSFIDVTAVATDDTSAEGPEEAVLEVFPGSGYVIAGSHVAALTIQDSDSALPVVGLMVVQANGSENGESATLAMTRSGPTTAPLTVRYTAAGSATSGSDYTALPGQLLIPAGTASALLTVAPLNDNAPEGSETVIISLSTNAAYIRSNDSAATSGTINIIDDDLASITVTASDPGATEVGSDPGIFLISRTGNTSQPLTVNYALSGSAHQGVDYAPVPGVLTIAAGSSVGTVTIVPIDDGVGEPQQTVVLQIRGGIGYAVQTPNSATVNISDNNDLPVVTVGVSDGSVGEPSSTGRFRFTTTGTGSGNITVNYTVEGTATPGTDYTAVAGTLSMGRNTTAEITITPINDSVAEGYETVTVTIDPDPAYTIHLETSATLNLADDDQPVVSVSTTNDSFSEGSGTGKFWISRSGSTTSALTVSYAMGGSATNGSDYTSLPGTISIPAAAAGVAVNIAPINDTVVEGSESITLTLAAGAYGIGIGSATHYLADTETPAVQVRFASSSGSGTENVGAVNIAVNLSAAAAVPVTVQYEIGGGSATAGVDYALTPGALLFAPGESAKIIPLTITDDVYDEPAQTVIVKLLNATGAALGTSTHTYTINDNDNPPAAVIGFAGATSSGAESTSPAPIVVSLSAPQAGAVSIDYLAGSGTATSGDDYVLAGGRLTFAPGETAKIIPSTVINDSVLEPNETIVTTISNPIGATLGAIVSHTYSIFDDDAATITVVVNDAAAAENNDSGSFLLTRTGSLVNPLTANLSVTGSAGNGTDYSTLGPTVDFAAGAATAEVTVTPLDDANGEGAETVTITVTPGAGYAVGNPNAAVLTIVDDEPGVSIAASEPNAAELNAEPGIFTLTRSGSTAASLNVTVTFTGSAAAGTDYASLTSPVSIPAGASSATVSVVPVNDSAAEGAETVIATIGAGAGYFVAAPAVATVTIADDDINLPPVIAVTSPAETSIGIPTGVGLILEATVSDDGKPLAPGRVTTTWSRVSGPAAVLFGNAAEATTTASFTAPGTYQLRLSATDGEFQAATVLNVVVGGNPAWTSQDVGAVGLAGSFAHSNGTYTVRGAGANITGTGPDAFRFAFQQMSGDGEIRARVVSMVGGNSSAKAGVMFRNTLATNSRLAYMSLYGAANTSDDSSFRARATDGGAMTTVSTDGQNAPYWVRVVRTGDIFSGYASEDGESWTQIGSSQTVAMNAQVLVGLAVTSNNVAALTTAQFDNVNLSSWPANVGPDADAGSDLSVTLPSPGTLAGSAVDDGKPAPPGEVTTLWSALSGPGTVSFADPARLDTSATFSQPGLYVVRLVADDGAVKTFDDVSVSALIPLIGVQTTGPGASERGPVSGTFTFTRSGSTAFSLSARFTISGTATAGTDYAVFAGTVTFPIGESSVILEVVPVTDEISEGPENVILNLELDPSYTIGSGSSATTVIADLPIDAWRYARFGVNANDPAIAGIQIDLDGDGLSNLLEYAFATDPFSANAAAPRIDRDGNDLTLTYRRPSGAADILYTVEEFGAGIGGWSPSAFTEEMISDDETVRVMKARVPIAGALEKTLRLRVTRN